MKLGAAVGEFEAVGFIEGQVLGRNDSLGDDEGRNEGADVVGNGSTSDTGAPRE